MPVFTYNATDKSGKLVTGKITATEKQDVVTILQNQQFLPIRIEQERKIYPNLYNLSFSNPFKEASQKDILIFTQQLCTLLKSGIILDRSLFILTDLAEKKSLRNIIETIRNNVHSGSTFADALCKYPKIFPKLYTSMIKAGEMGGVLDEVLERLSDFLEKSQKLKNNVQSALIYPLLLTLVGGSAVFILMVFVIPEFAQIFSDMGHDIPISTAVLMAISAFIAHYWWAILFFTILAFYMGKYYIDMPEGKLKWDNLKLKTPLIGSLLIKIEASRFCRTLGTLMKSGVQILQSLVIVKEVINNEIISKSLANIHDGVKVGKGISGPLKESNALPPLAIHMISIGEETGNLEEMLFKVADIYDNDVEISIKKLISLIEPFMILLMGAFVGFIVLSLLTAIFSINEIPF